ncbi:MAG: hypothetical protein CM15mP102_20250 [Flavobacteriales bacterium]|nr:MAG: hypothetical protein CM15mP102_20250 [Flavobacteriales bacterium]
MSKLNLEKMVPNNTDPLETAFTVSVDLKGNGVTLAYLHLIELKLLKH